MHALGKVYPNSDMVRKILQSLPKSWEAKVTTIKEFKGLTKLPLDELIGSLMAHDITMSGQEDGEKKKKTITLKSSIIVE